MAQAQNPHRKSDRLGSQADPPTFTMGNRCPLELGDRVVVIGGRRFVGELGTITKRRGMGITVVTLDSGGTFNMDVRILRKVKQG